MQRYLSIHSEARVGDPGVIVGYSRFSSSYVD